MQVKLGSPVRAACDCWTLAHLVGISVASDLGENDLQELGGI